MSIARNAQRYLTLHGKCIERATEAWESHMIGSDRLAAWSFWMDRAQHFRGKHYQLLLRVMPPEAVLAALRGKP